MTGVGMAQAAAPAEPFEGAELDHARGSSSPVRVLHVGETIMGGVGTYLNQIIPPQQAAFGRDHVSVLVPEEHVTQLPSLNPEAIRTFRRLKRSPAGILRLSGAILRAVRELQPTIIHAHSTFAGAIVRLIYGWRRDRPTIIYCPHGWVFDVYPPGLRRSATQLIERALSVLCDRIVAVSALEATKARAAGIADDKVTIVLNGIPAERPAAEGQGWDDDRLKVLFIGRLDWQKGFDTLQAAVAGLQDKVVVRVAGASIVGGGKAKPTAPNIELLGWVTPGQVDRQLSAADVLVIPSRWEGLPLTALEAMRAALPVVASNVGGLPEVVVDGVTGRIVSPDDVEGLRQAILRDDAAARREMGAAGRARFLTLFTIERVNQELLALYSTLEARRKRR
jgi:glycosyltransferase involved in cell wall biosynthesis